MHSDGNHEAYIAGFNAGLELAKSYAQIAVNAISSGLTHNDVAEHAYVSWNFKNEKRSAQEVESNVVEYLVAEAKRQGLTMDVIDRKELPGMPFDLVSSEGWALRWHTTNGTLAQFSRRNDGELHDMFFPSSWLYGYKVTNDKCVISEPEGIIPFVQEHLDVIRRLQKKAQREGA